MTPEEKENILNHISEKWKSFIQMKKETKDIRLLFTPNEDFLELIYKFSFRNLNWLESPIGKKHPTYEIHLHKNWTDIEKFRGQKGSWLLPVMKNVWVSPNYTGFVEFDTSELNLIESLFEEFGLYEYIMQVDDKWDYNKWKI